MKKLLLLALLSLICTGAYSQHREQALFMRSVQQALHPRKDIAFSTDKQELTDSATGKKTSVRTYYYFHKPSGKLRFVSEYRHIDEGKYPEVRHYYFAGDSLKKVGVFPHPKRCKDCYGIYSFVNNQLSGKEEANMPPENTGRLLMNALEYEVKAALLFKKPAP